MPNPSEQPHLTWPALLAHWTAFAQSSLAMPKSAEGERWRGAVPAIIGLQALTHALAEVDRVDGPGGRAAAIDLAAVSIHSHADALRRLWNGEELHKDLLTMIDDAQAALAAAGSAGFEWTVAANRLVVEHPAELVEELLAAGFSGDLYLPVPGTVLFKTSPAAFIRGAGGAEPAKGLLSAVAGFLGEKEVSGPRRAPGLRQVYRQFDFGAGRVVRDLVLAAGDEPPPGQAQLVAAIRRGRTMPVTLPIPGMSDQKAVPVVFTEPPRAEGVPIIAAHGLEGSDSGE